MTSSMALPMSMAVLILVWQLKRAEEVRPLISSPWRASAE